MCPAHRKRYLKIIRWHLDNEEAGGKLICVSTQLIEAGVDVDFGSVIRFEAGLDSIAQAAGRCNRNGRRSGGNVHVINPREENLGMLRDIDVGREKAAWVMDEFQENPERFGNSLLGKEAMDAYYEKYFFSRSGEMGYQVSGEENGRDDSLLNMLSENSLALSEHIRREGKAPEMMLRQSFMAAAKAFRAIDSATQGVIVPYGKDGNDIIADLCGAFDAEKDFRLLKQAQQYSVNVFASDLKKLQAAGAVHPIQEGLDIFHLDPRFYSKTLGLSTVPVGKMEFLNG